mgnify:CR=1 FL=1
MFTWNFQYVSKTRLTDNFNQLMLNPERGDILVRIHTSIHLEDEAVDLARHIKKLVPAAHIVGTSTSAPICWGRMITNQCIISVTQMSQTGHIRSAILPLFNKKSKAPIPPAELINNLDESIVGDDTKVMLTFLSDKYSDCARFVSAANDRFPGIRMVGGTVSMPDFGGKNKGDVGFVFDEDGWSDESILVASIGGESLEALATFATGAQPIGEESEITEADGQTILKIDGEDAADVYIAGTGEAVKEDPELSLLLPYVYSDRGDIPFIAKYDGESHTINANHNVEVGSRIRRAFIYDEKVISDNRAMFQRIENFAKAETVFGYSCSARALAYPTCTRWEFSVYENSNMCGCITDGEIVHLDGKNIYANCSFNVCVMGEEVSVQEYNPYVFAYTDDLATDNQALLTYLMDAKKEMESADGKQYSDTLKAFVHDYEQKLLISMAEEMPNAAALNMDMKTKGYDRICLIDVADTGSLRVVYSEDDLRLVRRNYTKKCVGYARKKKYHIYALGGWRLAIGAASYLISLGDFLRDMEELQHELFEASEDFATIVPMFCLIDDCDVNNMFESYAFARVEMAQKNMQFFVTKASSGELDVEKIKERYHMVNVINYAIAHDGIKPFYQGIYDNKNKCIHHYESLMRIEDETGRIYNPGQFLDVARSFGLLYDTISLIMIQKVFEKFRAYDDMSVSINLGLRDIKNHKLISYIYDFLSTVTHPEHFIFEILENEDVDDYEYLVNFVDRIHDLGGLIAIDDFGSGFSNLQHVLSIQTDFLKIDGSIIKRCNENIEAERLVSLIASWRHLGSRKFKIIAEFVENEDIQKIMEKYHVDYSQGYLFSKPAPDIEVDAGKKKKKAGWLNDR